MKNLWLTWEVCMDQFWMDMSLVIVGMVLGAALSMMVYKVATIPAKGAV
jgi:hypothetical protein